MAAVRTQTARHHYARPGCHPARSSFLDWQDRTGGAASRPIGVCAPLQGHWLQPHDWAYPAAIASGQWPPTSRGRGPYGVPNSCVGSSKRQGQPKAHAYSWIEPSSTQSRGTSGAGRISARPLPPCSRPPPPSLLSALTRTEVRRTNYRAGPAPFPTRPSSSPGCGTIPPGDLAAQKLPGGAPPTARARQQGRSPREWSCPLRKLEGRLAGA